MTKTIFIIISTLLLNPLYSQIKLVVLGTVQDAGSPHIACKKNCCKDMFNNPDPARKVVSLGVVDTENKMNWIFDATPDFSEQMKMLKNHSPFTEKETPSGIFLTHAHIGHYTGLMYLGREAMSSKKLTVYSMPKMKTFLENNGPWNQLVKLDNISLNKIDNEKPIYLSTNFTVTPILVPHRDEYSETVGYRMKAPNKTVLFIPDIDKWILWNKDIVEEIKRVDHAFLDATFYDGSEVNNRDISEIPHPFVIESMEIFNNLPMSEKAKIYFIHFNHTNPLLNRESQQAKTVLEKGYNLAEFNMTFDL